MRIILIGTLAVHLNGAFQLPHWQALVSCTEQSSCKASKPGKHCSRTYTFFLYCRIMLALSISSVWTEAVQESGGQRAPATTPTKHGAGTRWGGATALWTSLRRHGRPAVEPDLGGVGAPGRGGVGAKDSGGSGVHERWRRFGGVGEAAAAEVYEMRASGSGDPDC
jgi:hypothetical protein